MTANKIESSKKLWVEGFKAQNKRMNFNGDFYLKIFEKAVKDYNAAKKKQTAHSQFRKSKTAILAWFIKYQVTQKEMKRNEIIAITFAALFLECIIWDYAAVNTSQSIAEDSLSNLNLLGRWKVVPKLVNNNKSINIDSEAIFLLKKLKHERDKIVHSKSKPVPNNYDDIKKQEGKSREITVPETVDCVKKCVDGLKKIDTTSYWYFKK